MVLFDQATPLHAARQEPGAQAAPQPTADPAPDDASNPETAPQAGQPPIEVPGGPQVAQPPPLPSALLKIEWTSQLPAPPIAPAGFDLTHAFVPLRDQVVAVSLVDGGVKWAVKLPAPNTPVTGQGQIFVAADETLCALSPVDGSIVWSLHMGAPPSAPLTWDNGWLFAGTANAELFAFRASDGQPQWRRILGSPLRARAVPADERVYVSLEDGRVAALDIHTGETLWERPLDGTPAEILALDDRLFVGSKDNFFYCIDVRNGKVRWRWRTGADIIGAPIVDESRVYFLSSDNMLRALARGGGALRWQRGLPMRASSGPVRLEDLLIVPGVAAEFTAYSMKDGFPMGSYRAAADLAAPPHLYEKPVDPVVGAAPSHVGSAAALVSQPATPNVPSVRRSAAAEGSKPSPAEDLPKLPAQQLIVITKEGGLEALIRAPKPPPAAATPPSTVVPSPTAPGQVAPAPAPGTTPPPDQQPTSPAPVAPTGQP